MTKKELKKYTGKLCKLSWKLNGYDHQVHGLIKEVSKGRIVFLISGETKVNLKSRWIYKITLLA